MKEDLIKLLKNVRETAQRFALGGFPRYDGESWYAETRQIEERYKEHFELMQLDGAHFYMGKDDLGVAIRGLIELRDEIGYLFEMVLFAPEEGTAYNWSAYNRRLDYVQTRLEAAFDKPVEPIAEARADAGVQISAPADFDAAASVLKRASTKEPDLTTVEGVVENIVQAYLDKSTAGIPWIAAVSWGKDSTAMLKFIVEALLQIPPELRTRPIYVSTVDTKLEFPMVLDHMRRNVQDFRKYATVMGLPIEIHVAEPVIDDRYLVCILGKGYLPPKPGNIRRFCTDRIKLRPSTRAIKELAGLSGKGKGILLMGTRLAESAARARSIHRYEGEGRYGRTIHSHLASYTPIKYLSTEDIWTYLAIGKLPWGNGFATLRQLYFSSTGECPLVRDKSTPAGCGGSSRLGCIFCLLLREDKAMANLIEFGYACLEPILEFRELLRGLEYRLEFREPYPRDRRTAQKMTRASRTKNPFLMGGFNLEGRMFLLRELLATEQRVLTAMEEEGVDVLGGYRLIEEEEIQRIKSWWHHLDGYIEPGFVPDVLFPEKAPSIKAA